MYVLCEDCRLIIHKSMQPTHPIPFSGFHDSLYSVFCISDYLLNNFCIWFWTLWPVMARFFSGIGHNLPSLEYLLTWSKYRKYTHCFKQSYLHNGCIHEYLYLMMHIIFPCKSWHWRKSAATFLFAKKVRINNKKPQTTEHKHKKTWSVDEVFTCMNIVRI